MIVIVVILVLICLGCCLALKREHALLCKARKSDKMKTAFIKGLSREIRTHLHSVSGLAEIISKEDLYLSKSEKRNISTQIKYNTSLVSTLLDEVTVFSDEKGGHQIQDDRFSPNILCQHCLDANLSLAHEGVRMILRSQLDSNYFVSADHHIVELVMNKLVQCACHFTDTCATRHEDGTSLSKRLETKELIAELKKTNPYVESNIFRSVENVNLNTVIEYKKDGVRHNFLDEY